MVTANNVNQQIALEMGWNGSGQGQGGQTAWYNGLTPQQKQIFDQTVSSNGGSGAKPTGSNIVLPSSAYPTPTGTITPNNEAQQVALTMGWNGAGQGQGGQTAWYNSLTPAQQVQFNSMVGTTGTSAPQSLVPALQEPLNQMEKSGITTLNQGVDTSGMSNILSQLQSRLSGSLDTSNKMVSQATQPITADQVTALANPMAEGLNQNLSIAAQHIRAQALAGQGLRGGASFGDTATGNENGLIDQGVLEGQNTNNYNAWTAALAQLNQQNSNLLTGANTTLQGANTGLSGDTTAFNGAQTIGQTGRQNALDQIQAGGSVRNFNQGIDDKMQADLTASQNYPADQIQKILDMLKSYQSQDSNSQTGGMANGASQVGGALQAASALAPTLYAL